MYHCVVAYGGGGVDEGFCYGFAPVNAGAEDVEEERLWERVESHGYRESVRYLVFKVNNKDAVLLLIKWAFSINVRISFGHS